MNKIIISIFLVFFTFSSGKGQLLISGNNENIIYSGIKNKIHFISSNNCEELIAKIDGFDKDFIFSDCCFEVNYLKFDSSTIRILNKSNKLIFDTILIRNNNKLKAYIQIGDILLTKGTISKEELEILRNIRVKHECPWQKELEIVDFLIIVTDKNGKTFYKRIKGNKIPRYFIQDIANLQNPNKLYIEHIKLITERCFQSVNSIELDIK